MRRKQPVIVYGLGAPSNYTNAIVSFIWGAGGQVAVQKNGKRLPEASIQSMPIGADAAALAAAIRAAAERPLIIVVRDAHWHPAARAAVDRLLSARPDAVVVEIGPARLAASGGPQLSGHLRRCPD